jgi:hypothetical protein
MSTLVTDIKVHPRIVLLSIVDNQASQQVVPVRIDLWKQKDKSQLGMLASIIETVSVPVS